MVFIAGIYGADQTASLHKAKEMASRFNLDVVLTKKAKTLSGGMQRRLSIAMALISSPQILFLNEPTLGLDVIARRELWTSIKALKGKVTIILTTHYLDEVEVLADRIGGAFKTAADIMPFYHSVESIKAICNGAYLDAIPHICIVLGYTVIIFLLAIIVFKRKMKENAKT